MDKIEVSQRARKAALDAYMTCFETVPNDLWLQALLDGKHDGDETAQAFARFERDILATRTDATPVAVEMVAELQLSAFLAGRGSIRTKANGNTHESSPGPTMDDYRRMARFALAEGQVDATPVAFISAERLNRKREFEANGAVVYDRPLGTSTMPLYTHPPATDVAALVDAATGDDVDAWFQVGALKEQLRQANETIKAINGHLPAYAAAMKENKELKSAEADLVKVIRAQPYPESDDYIEVRRDERERIISAIAPFTKGQNDD